MAKRKKNKEKIAPISHEEGERIICDLLGVDDLDVVRELLREENEMGKGEE